MSGHKARQVPAKSADAREIDNKQLARDTVPIFSLHPKQHTSCTSVTMSAVLQLVDVSVANEDPGLGKKGVLRLWIGMYLRTGRDPFASKGLAMGLTLGPKNPDKLVLWCTDIWATKYTYIHLPSSSVVLLLSTLDWALKILKSVLHV